jgi:hypothetical protein
MPEWDLTLRVPLMNERYYASELVDSTDIFVDPNDVVYMRNVGQSETPELGTIAIQPNFPTQAIPILSGVEFSGSFSIVDPVNNYQLVYGLLENSVFQSRFSQMLSGVSSVLVTFVELRNPDGSPFQISYSGNEEWQNTNLNFHYIGTSGSSAIIEDIHYTILTISNHATNTVVGQFELAMDGDLAFSKFEGRLPNFRLDMEDTTSSLDIEYPYGLQEAIQLLEATINLTLTSYVGFETEFHGEFYAINYATGDTRILELVDANFQYYMTAPAIGGQPGITNIIFSNRVNELLQIMPDYVELRNSYFLIKSTTNMDIGSVRKADRIIGDYVINAPFHFTLVEDQNTGYTKRIIIKETVDLEISGENRNRIRDNALLADMAVSVINTLPVGVKAELYVGSEPNIDIDDPDTFSFVKSFNVISGTLAPGNQSIDLSLTKAQIDVFDNPMVYLQWVFYFEASAESVTITASQADYIHVQSMLTARIHVQESK